MKTNPAAKVQISCGKKVFSGVIRIPFRSVFAILAAALFLTGGIHASESKSYTAIVYLKENSIIAENAAGGTIASAAAGKGDNDWTVIQAAISSVKSAGGGVLEIAAGTYRVTRTLDFHSWPSKPERDRGACIPNSLKMHPATKIISSAKGLPAMDFTGTFAVAIENGWLEGAEDNPPSCGMLFARNPDGDTSGEHRLYNCRIEGRFTVANIYNLGSEVNWFAGLVLRNREDNGFCFKIVYDNVDNITSPCSSPYGGKSMAGLTIGGMSQIVHLGKGTGGAIYIGGGDSRDIRIKDSYLHSKGLAKIQFINPAAVLHGVYQVENIYCEGESKYGIYAECSSLNKLYLKGFTDYMGAQDNLYFNSKLNDCSFIRPFFLGGKRKLYASHSIIDSIIEGDNLGIEKIQTGGDMTHSAIIIPDMAEVACGGTMIGTMIRTTDHQGRLKMSPGTIFGFSGGGAAPFSQAIISDGSIQVKQNFVAVETANGAAEGVLDTINGGMAGDVLILHPQTAGRMIVLKHAAGNIKLDASTDFSMHSPDCFITLIYDGSYWQELSRKANTSQEKEIRKKTIPPNLPQAENEHIIDIGDHAHVVITGDWKKSGAYIHDKNEMKGQKNVRFIPEIKEDGKYAVYISWTFDENRATNVPVDIIHAQGSTTVTVNQKQKKDWLHLGTFSFSRGNGGYVVLKTDMTNGYVIADKVKFVLEK